MLLLIRKKFRKLILPYFLWNVFYGIVVMLTKQFGFEIGKSLNLYTLFVQPFIDGHQFYFNLAAWFVPALFIIEISYLIFCKVFKMIIKKNKLRKLVMFALLLFMGIMGVAVANQGEYSDSPVLILLRTLFFLPFYCLGNLYKEVLEENDLMKNVVYFGIIFGAQLLIIMHYGWIPTFSAAFGVFFTNPVMQYLCACLGIAFWLRIAKLITPIVKKDGFIIYIGRHTFSIMMHHIGIIYLIMLLLAGLKTLTGVFSDLDIQDIKTNAGSWYCPGGNQNFLLFYLAASIGICIALCKLKDKLQSLYKTRVLRKG